MSVTTIPTAGIADGAVDTTQLADDAVGNTKLDLTANYAFTGTVTGASDAVLISSSTGGGTATQQINGCFSSTYKYYMVLANITMSSNAHVFCRFQDSSNAELTGGVYYYQGYQVTNAAGSLSVSGNGDFGGNAFGPNQTLQAASNRFGAYRLFIYDPFSSSTKTNYSLHYTCQAAASNLRTTDVAGVYDTATSMTGIRFLTTASSTIGSASTFKVYGFK